MRFLLRDEKRQGVRKVMKELQETNPLCCNGKHQKIYYNDFETRREKEIIAEIEYNRRKNVEKTFFRV